jgi:hypothetical protein
MEQPENRLTGQKSGPQLGSAGRCPCRDGGVGDLGQLAEDEELEPPRVCRRLFGLSYAARAVSCNWA